MWSWANTPLHGWTLLAQADPAAAGAKAVQVAGEAASTAQQPPQSGAFIEQLLIFGGIFVVFWLLVLRPQQKRAKEHKGFVEALKVGSRVVTNSGMFGKVTAIDGREIKLEIANKVVVRQLKSQIAGLEADADEAVAKANTK